MEDTGMIPIGDGPSDLNSDLPKMKFRISQLILLDKYNAAAMCHASIRWIIYMVADLRRGSR